MVRNIEDVAKYVGLNLYAKGYGVTPLKLQKVLYYVQAWYMVFYDKKKIFEERPQAWVNGPAYPTVYAQYKGVAPDMYSELKPASFGTDEDGMANTIQALSTKMCLSEEELEVIDNIISLYGTRTQEQLVMLTHSEKPWADMRQGLAPYQSSTKELDLDVVYDYYKARYDRNRSKKES